MSDFYFVEQQILDAKTRGVYGVELLLRFKAKAGFPVTEFHKLIECSDSNYNDYLNDLNMALVKLIKIHPKYRISINFSQQELEFPATIIYLENLDRKIREQIIIEVTEQAPTKRYTNYSETINVKVFKRLFELGYQIALDDIMQGNNSIGNFMLVRPYISSIKWSLINGGKRLNRQEIYWTINLLHSLTRAHNISFVVEGVEEKKISDWLLSMNVHSQQGFFFSKPHTI